MPTCLRNYLLIASCCTVIACGPDEEPGLDGSVGTDAPAAECAAAPTLERGMLPGHATPLGASAGEARAGRIEGSALPPFPSGLQVWDEGGFVIANDRVAMVIEDAGPSHLYDPWGGRPMGIARVQDGALVDPGDFGEVLILQGRFTVMTTHVGVLRDGSDGGPAIVRAVGPMRALPFFDEITRPILATDLSDFEAAIDYVLEPDSQHVDVIMHLASPRPNAFRPTTELHGFMYTPRMPVFAPGGGFDPHGVDQVPFLALTDEHGVGFAYADPAEDLAEGIVASGFVSRFGRAPTLLGCRVTEVHHARMTIGGPGLDGLLVAMAQDEGRTLREISGVVSDATGAPAAGVRVHVIDAEGEYLTRSMPTGEDGRYAVHVPEGAVTLHAYRQGEAAVGPLSVAADVSTQDISMGPSAFVHVVTTDPTGAPLPARIQLLPGAGSSVSAPSAQWGEEEMVRGRIAVALSETGEATMRAPLGAWRVAISRGYEYELVEQSVMLATAGETVEVSATLARVVDTTDVQCGDFHIHTRRSNDSADDEWYKLRGALADGLEIPVRSDHEYVNDFQPMIVSRGVEAWLHGIASVELSSMEVWGHMGVVPLTPDPAQINGGTPLWQEYPTLDAPDVALRLMQPVEVFRAARARPESPVVIINHPRGDTNYFGYTGWDPITGMVTNADAWDEDITHVEVFNDADWVRTRDGTVRDWLGLLNHGYRVYAVGSSDSHSLSNSPVGYPRTCMQLGSDDPRDVTPTGVRDALAAGRMSISGGVYVDASVEGQGPGSEISGVGATATLHVRAQAAAWVDVDSIEIVVDGESMGVLPITASDADPGNPVIRLERDYPIPVRDDGVASYVVVAVWGDAALEPVTPGRRPFGVSNPIFLRR